MSLPPVLPTARIDQRSSQRFVYIQTRDDQGFETFQIVRDKIPNERKARKLMRNINRLLRRYGDEYNFT